MSEIALYSSVTHGGSSGAHAGKNATRKRALTSAIVLTVLSLSAVTEITAAASVVSPRHHSKYSNSEMHRSPKQEKRRMQNAAPQAWIPSKAQIAKIETILAKKRLVGAPLSDRVRAYSGTVENGKRYIIGALLTAVGQGKSYNSQQRDEQILESWEPGRYIVPLSRFPGRVSIVPDNSCDYIKVVFDANYKSIHETYCIR